MILCMMITVPLVVVRCNKYDSVYDDYSSQGSTLTFKSTCPIGQVLEKVTCPHFLPVARFTAQQHTVIILEEVQHVT